MRRFFCFGIVCFFEPLMTLSSLSANLNFLNALNGLKKDQNGTVNN